MPELTQYPETGKHLQRFCGDTIEFELTSSEPVTGRAFLCTNVGNAAIHRDEIIRRTEQRLNQIGQDWNNIPMQRTDEYSFRVRLALSEVGHFECKCGIVDDDGNTTWVKGDNLHLNVISADYCASNTVYCAFVRQFGANKTRSGSALPDGVTQESITRLDESGYSVIPAGGTFRGLIRELDHIVDRLKCRIIHLLPINPVPTTYARMGRFGSPYASQDFTAVDPALAEFDTKASPLEQFFELVDAVHRKNACIFLDIAINHTGWASKLQEEHPDWFVRKDDGTYVSPGAWGVTWGDLIELDHKNPPLWSYLANVFLTWCRRGVDGFRCDAGYMIPEAAWEYIIAMVRREFPDTVFLLEGLGGATEVTQALLDRANMDWAYSELFQNYSRDQIEGYLNYAWNESCSNGIMIHYAETHDNNRLATSGERYARLRTALSALASSCGAFGFTNGVEWFAKEKVDVHQDSALNWGAETNQIDFIARLNTILALHPAFFNGAFIRCIDSGSPDAVVIIRTNREAEHFILVAMNLNCDRTVTAEWDASYATFTREKMYDLISGRRLDILSVRGHKWSLPLSPGRVVCLSPEQQWIPKIEEAAAGGRLEYDHLEDQQAAALVLTALTAKRKTPVLADDDVPALTRRLRESPEGFLQDLFSDRPEIPYVVWNWPTDLRREIIVAPGRSILVAAPVRFRFFIVRNEDNRVIASARSIHCKDGRFVSIVPPLPTPDKPTELRVAVFVSEGDELRRDTAVLMLMPRDIDKAVVSLTRDEFFMKGRTFLQANGRGGAVHVCIETGRLLSRYDAIMLANLHPEIPVDRHIMWRRFRMWMIYRARRQQITSEMIDRFHIASDGGAVLGFKVPVGNARVVGLMLKLSMIPEKNAVRASFLRYAYTGSGETIDDSEPVQLLISPDLEDRNFHCLTKASEGPQDTFPAAVTESPRGFVFRPASDRIFRMTASSGTFRRADEWSYMNYQENEAERGLDPNCDLYSPGYFKCSLNGNETLHLIGQIMTSEDEPKISPVPEEKPCYDRMTDDLQTVMLNSLKAFIVKRGDLKTVIAGYPWFLDWGRDTLIFVRGLITEPVFHEDVKQILVQFASLVKDGTICNMISGTDTGNRDTSDAPLWLFIGVRDMCVALGNKDFLKTKVKDRGTLLDLLVELAEGLVKGTPNGIACDAESGLIFSPAHFTWMDTNYPAGTPREGYPVEIQALWYASLRFLAESLPEKQAARWSELAARVKESFLKYFPLKEEGFLSDCLHCKPGTPASKAEPDDHLRPNQLLAITLGLVEDKKLRRIILLNTSELLVPGGIRSLADRPVKYPLPVYGADGKLLNDPYHPYQGHYCGDEDTRRKVAYHNGTAWTWQMPLFPEAYYITHGRFGRATAISLLSSMAVQLDNGCIMHMPEILDGDYPHKPRGCDAQAWGLSEYYRVWKLLHPASKSTGKDHE